MKSILRHLSDRFHRGSDLQSPDSEPSPASGQVELESLEPRVLFSAAPVEAPAEASENPEAPAADVQVETAATQSTAVAAAATQSTAGDVQVAAETSPEPASPSLPESGQGAVSSDQGVTLVDVSPEAAQLNQESLDAIAVAAADRWKATGLSAAQEAALDNATYQVADLDGGNLGGVLGSTITLDIDAGGRGWFADATPGDDIEFDVQLGDNYLGASGGSWLGYDVLSVIMHEQGHLLGLDHLPAELQTGNIMTDFFSPNQRILPAAGQAGGATPVIITETEYATFSVTSLSGGVGAGSLHTAIVDANTAPGADLITFSGAASAGTITLTADLPFISGDLTITGPGAGSLTIDGDDTYRIFANNSGVTTEITDLTLTGGIGKDEGFGIRSGGAIFNNGGTMTIRDMVIHNNSADFGGGILNQNSGTSTGTFNVYDSTIRNNTATADAANGSGGGGAYNWHGNFGTGDAIMLIEDSTVRDNVVLGTVFAHGGGVFNGGDHLTAHGDAQLTINGSTISGNTAPNRGGGVYSAASSTAAGADTVNLTIDNSTISGNTSQVSSDDAGGGVSIVFATSHATITHSSITGNMATGADGGGGGIATNDAGTLTLHNSTVSGNTASRHAGGVHIFGGSPAVSIVHSTIAFNTATGGSGGGIRHAGSATIDMSSTIVSNNSGSSHADISGDVGSTHGHNLVLVTTGTTLSGTTTGNVTGTDPALVALANNGGSTETHAILDTSAAFEAGEDAAATGAGLTTDQRGAGFGRNLGDSVDIGAFEVFAEPEITIEHDPTSDEIVDGETGTSGIALEGTDFGSVDTATGMETRVFRITNNGNSSLTLSGTPVDITGTGASNFSVTVQPTPLVLGVGASTTFSVEFDPMADGVHNAEIEVTSDDANEALYNFAITGTGTTVVTAPEIYVEHDSSDDEIADGETGTSGILLEGTDFGSVDTATGSEVRTFLIRNDGTAVLTISQPTLSDDTHFDVSTIMGGDLTLDPAETRTFTVTFDPTADGVHTDTVNLVNNDGDENPYNFAITGTGTTTGPPATEESGVTVVSGNLVITDVLGGDTDDDLTISTSTTTLTIVDNNGNGIDLGGVTGTGDGTDTVTIDYTEFTGGIVWDALGGNDTLTIDFTPDNFSREITFNGGAQPIGDELFLTGGTPFATATYNFTNENDGTIDLAGNSLITYTGLEPITSTITAAVVTLNYSSAAETIGVTASGSSTRVDSTAGEVVTFTNPTATLNINAGDGDDTINVNGFGTGFGAGLTIDGQVGSDKINYYADGVNLGTGNGATFTAEQIDFIVGDLTTSDGNITLNGTGGSGGSFTGIRLIATDLETGSGDISLTGQGGDTGSNNEGVQLSGSSLVTTGGGSIAIDGTGGGPGSGGHGVTLYAGSSLSASGSGTVAIDGTSSTAGTLLNHGVYLVSGSSANVVNGGLTIAGTGAGSFGLSDGFSAVGAKVTGTGSGNISITGASNGGFTNNRGIGLSGSTIGLDPMAPTGTGSVTLNGIGSSSGTSNNEGVSVVDTDIATGGNGAIDIDGQGGGTGAGTGNTGVSFLTGSTAAAAGSGALNIDGTAGDGSLFNRGVYVSGGITLSTVNGAVTMRGTGDGSMMFNTGLDLSSSTVEATGTGSLTLWGSGSSNAGASGFFNSGVSIVSSTVSASSNGNITITGNGGSGSSYNEGVRIQSSNVTTSGTTEIVGNANSGTTGVGNAGVYIYLNSTVNGDASSSITGNGGGGSLFNHGIFMGVGITSNVPLANIVGTKGPGDPLFNEDEAGDFF